MKVKHFATAILAALVLTHPCAAAPGDIQACAGFIPFGQPTLNAPRPVTLLCRTGYLVAHDDERLTYDWVAWTLTKDHSIGCAKRKDQFHIDQDLPAEHRASPSDYAGTGYDQGHGFPLQDGTWDVTVEYSTFAMSNMAPQAPDLNEQGWEQLEEDSRAWAVSELGPLTIYDIPIWNAAPKTIGKHNVAVPDAFAKVIYSPAKHQAFAVVMPNAPAAKSEVAKYAVSVAEVERQAGITVPLPADVDKSQVVPLWDADLSGFKKVKKAHCTVPKQPTG